jgi:Ca2+-binding EF-hand superfamily protein
MSERFKTVREAFIRIDSDGDGYIGPPELRAQLEMMGMRLSGREFRRLWRVFDTSGDDQLNYVEFNNKVGKFIKPASIGLQMNRPETPPMKDWQQKNVAAQIRKRVTDIDATFNEIDQDASGVIDQTELMIALRKLGLRGIGDQECYSMMNRFRNPAKNKTPGTMTREEFKACMTEYLKVPEATLKSISDDERAKVAAAADKLIVSRTGTSRAEIAAALARFDAENLHDLSHVQMRDALAALGALLNDEQWAALCFYYDPEKDGSFGIAEFSTKLAGRVEQAQREAQHGASGGAEGAWARLGLQPAIDPVAGRRVEARLLARTIAPRLGMSEGEVVMLQALIGREGQARMAWERYDKENTGEVSKSDFIKGIEDAGAVIPVAGDLLHILASRFDRRKSGRMSFSDLLATYGKWLEPNNANVRCSTRWRERRLAGWRRALAPGAGAGAGAGTLTHTFPSPLAPSRSPVRPRPSPARRWRRWASSGCRASARPRWAPTWPSSRRARTPRPTRSRAWMPRPPSCRSRSSGGAGSRR